jgi:NAD+ kinase
VRRVCLVVHPSRAISRPLGTVRQWTAERGLELVQLRAGNHPREVAPLADPDACDLIVAMGGDGTVLTALRAAAHTGAPVLGVACGSLGALTAITADRLVEALDLFESGAWTRRELPGVAIAVDGEPPSAWAINDFVLVRRTGQLGVYISVDGELYARLAGDGIVVATALGSSAYSMAAGGPIMVQGTNALVATPLLAHGGCAPPLVVPASLPVTVEAHPGYSGFDIEIDGHPEPIVGSSFELTLVESKATLVTVGEPGLGLTALRRRGLIADSPRVLARDARSDDSL